MKFNLKKIAVIFVLISTLIIYFAVSVNASILPYDNADYNTAYSYSDGIEGTGYNVNLGTQSVFSFDEWTKADVDKMGTNNVANVSKPVIMLPMYPYRTNDLRFTFTVPNNVINNSYNDTGITGLYTFRFGIWLRCYDSKFVPDVIIQGMATQTEIANATIFEGKYIATPNDVRGRYYYCDFVVPFNANLNKGVSVQFSIEPNNGETSVLFPGNEPLYNNSFIALTTLHISTQKNNVVNGAPYSSGTILPYDTNNSLLLGESITSLGKTYVNPFTNNIEYTPPSNMLLTSSSYPYIGYYIVSTGQTVGQINGYMYNVYIVPNSITSELNKDNQNYSAYSTGYSTGYTTAEKYYQDIIAAKDAQYDEFVKQLGVSRETAYNKGYNDAVVKTHKEATIFYNTIDRLGNLARNIFASITSIQYFGISVSLIIFCSVLLVASYYILKKLR